jgi:hypothetical protein
MNKLFAPTFALMGCLTAGLAAAQAPAQQPTDPNAASTPHQRDVTKSPANEAAPTGGSNPSDASTPHQKSTLKKSHTKKKAKSSTPPPSQ